MSDNLISLCMIAKDEEEYLPRALANLNGFWDELIVVVDSRTTDRTAEIVEAAGGQVLTYEYVAPGHKGVARNMGIDAATGDWIVVLDCDEVIQEPDKLRKWLNDYSGKSLGFSPHFHLYYDGSVQQKFYVGRIFRNGAYRYKFREHEQPFLADGSQRFIQLPFVFNHYPPAQRSTFKKGDMLPRLLLSVEENPGEPAPIYFLCSHYFFSGNWEKVVTSGKQALEVIQNSNEWRKFYAEICGYIARAAATLNDYQLAIGSLEQAILREPQNKKWFVLLAHCYINNGHWRAAFALLLQVKAMKASAGRIIEPEVEEQLLPDLLLLCARQLKAAEKAVSLN